MSANSTKRKSVVKDSHTLPRPSLWEPSANSSDEAEAGGFELDQCSLPASGGASSGNRKYIGKQDISPGKKSQHGGASNIFSSRVCHHYRAATRK
jgi:hypothetical protein